MNSLIFIILIVQIVKNKKFYESKTYAEIMTDNYRKINWQLIVDDELQFYKTNKTWILILTFKDHWILIDRWIFTLKYNVEEQIIKYKIRWIVRDFEQKKDLNYHETFVLIIKFMNYKAFLIITVVLNWKIK